MKVLPALTGEGEIVAATDAEIDWVPGADSAQLVVPRSGVSAPAGAGGGDHAGRTDEARRRQSATAAPTRGHAGGQ